MGILDTIRRKINFIECPWCGEYHIDWNKPYCEIKKKKVYLCSIRRHAFKTQDKADNCDKCSAHDSILKRIEEERRFWENSSSKETQKHKILPYKK